MKRIKRRGFAKYAKRSDVIELVRPGDPAIDTGKTDMDAYRASLDRSLLVLRDGMEPRLWACRPLDVQEFRECQMYGFSKASNIDDPTSSVLFTAMAAFDVVIGTDEADIGIVWEVGTMIVRISEGLEVPPQEDVEK
jgi:hypothetical protein